VRQMRTTARYERTRVVAVVVAHDPCTRNPFRGTMEGGGTCERRKHLLRYIPFTEDTSQLPIFWLNAFAPLNTAQVPHAPQATQNTPHQNERGPVRVQKGLRTDLQGEVGKASEDRGHGSAWLGTRGRRRGTLPLRTQSLR
jgi:hypothetical protein